MGVAGHSARVEYERRAATREAAITERWGAGLVSKVVGAVSVEPESTHAWAIGAAAEEWRGDPPVSDELWARVEQVRRSKTRGGGPRNRGRVDLLAGLLECV